MDPSATLDQLRNALVELRLLVDGEPSTINHQDVVAEVAVLFENLDDWMCRGGFKPSQWDIIPQAQLRKLGRSR